MRLTIAGVGALAAGVFTLGWGQPPPPQQPATGEGSQPPSSQLPGATPTATAPATTPDATAPPPDLTPPRTSACASGYKRLSPAKYERGDRIDTEVAVKWQAPATLRFEVASTARLNQDQQFILDGTIINDANAPQQVVVFPVAGPATPSGAFRVIIGSDPRIKIIQSGPPGPPPAPPPPLRFELPACSALPVMGAANLTDLKYTPGISATLEWTYLYWNEPRPSGRVGGTLP